ncbi:hypothetical protein MNEG_3765 [Monoraphidium neglectum]|jgi:hypothetical protein|uniref:Uncharacterized protein n=1 Tax=Monoraphidium neglectum TaxID=145388 RepID=A0A0D2MUM3_9CHLO|nr:hypothetical protein MNEG_3765 [Monoraphidium neglectum]KIZ04197.1 hypothetical protein MNEG_3765 [Monoraphidium neglectum]|eukprot:XP_013903216.1 hypothetical protein MNEG_3765 [Monoraphidium neglectum]
MPLDLPELDELAPLLDCLPPLAGYDASVVAADGEGSGGASTGELLASGAAPSAAAVAAAAQRRRARHQLASGPAVAHAELQLLRGCLRLQGALRALAAAQAAQAAAAGERHKQQRRRLEGGAAPASSTLAGRTKPRGRP